MQEIQAITAKAVIVTLLQKSLELWFHSYTKALALGDIARLTFKRLFATRTAFYFMTAQDSKLKIKGSPRHHIKTFAIVANNIKVLLISNISQVNKKPDLFCYFITRKKIKGIIMRLLCRSGIKRVF